MNSTIETVTDFNSQYFCANLIFMVVAGMVCLITVAVICRKTKDRAIAFLLFMSLLYRIGLSVIYYYVSIGDPNADTHDYYLLAATSNGIAELYGYGFKFVVLLLFPFVRILKLNYFSCFMLNSMFGFLGLAFLVAVLKEQIASMDHGKWYFFLILFWPGLNFWTSMIGKDSLIFLGLSMLFYALSSLRKRLVLVVASLLLVVHIRPYLAMIIVPCLAMSMFFTSGGLGWKKRVLVICLLIAALMPISGVFFQMLGVEKLDYSTASTILEQRQSNWGGGSSLDLSNTLFLVKILIYLYRPLFFDAHSIPMLLVSIENLFLIFLSLRLLRPGMLIFWAKSKSVFVSFCVIYFSVGVTLLAVSTSNMGTAARQKNMVVFVLLLMNAIYQSHKKYGQEPAGETWPGGGMGIGTYRLDPYLKLKANNSTSDRWMGWQSDEKT